MNFEAHAPLNPLALFEALVDAGIDFIVVGGFAVAVHGVTRACHDVEVCPARFDRNLRLLTGVLRSICPRRPDLRELRAGDNLRLQTGFGPLCITQDRSPFGTRTFTILDRNAERHRVGTIEIRVCSYDDLLDMKQTAGTKQDLIDVCDLKTARREL